MVEITDERGTHCITYKSWLSYARALQREVQLLQQLISAERASKAFLGVVKEIKNGKLIGEVRS